MTVIERDPLLRGTAMGTLLRRAAAAGVGQPELCGLDALVGPGEVCFDLGAGHGAYSLRLAALTGPTGTVHAFETRPSRLLRVSARLAGAAVRVHGAAVGAAELRESPPTTTLDGVCAMQRIERVAFIRVGGEPAGVLAGAVATLQHHRPALLLTLADGELAADLRHRYGYHVSAWSRERWERTDATAPGRYLFTEAERRPGARPASRLLRIVR
ncbi:hypothetical protein [Pseudonocardia sp. GCM10023141]|uniref:hypothetical protein n=1 Tax=Pseudonocardia sp. GCM10023141 TaxID=3252653 RepID=UPI0036089F0F